MKTIRHNVARIAVRNRWATLCVALVATLVFAHGLLNVQARTVFSDLFPRTHPFVQAYSDHPNFGNPLTVTLMVERIDGEDIYTADTMDKIWKMSRDIDLVPGVDHDQIVSIATEKARYTAITADGIYSNPVMDDSPPGSAAELAEIRRRVNESPFVRTFLVSQDGTAALINATFIERLVDYGVVFEHVQALVRKHGDAGHRVHAAGWPMLTGWVYHFGSDTAKIFAVTLGLMFLCLLVVMRNTAGVLTPVIVSGLSAIWGFGFVGWLGHPVEPLLMVVPLLLIARSFSHSVQATERYYELLEQTGDKRKAAEMSLAVMVAPGTLGIFTDACGLLLVAVAPIPAMERFALFTGFWALMLVPTSVILTPVLLSLLPAPRNVSELVGARGSRLLQRILAGTLAAAARLATGSRARYTGLGFVLLGAVAIALMSRLQVGNPVEGSNLLREDSAFNTAVREINRRFPGLMTLEVIFEGKSGRIVRQSDTLTTMRVLQRCLEGRPRPPTATLSFADYAPEANRLFNGGNPKWAPLDRNDAAASAASTALMVGASPKAFLHVADFEQKNATVSLWYPDNRQATVDAALADARGCIEAVGSEHESFRIRLASGSIALQQSINETLDTYQWYILAGINLVVGLVVGLAYRSLAAALILLAPVNLANALLTAYMVLAGMGMDVNSLPILAIGIGVGIDYGIYLLSRICEEFRGRGHLSEAIAASLATCGKAILFTALLMTIGIVPWYFLSELKFLSDMGLLLVIVMTINMVLALLLVPLLVHLFQPRFVSAEHRLMRPSVGAGVASSVHA